ncbi:MAG: hypothetical protein QOC74_2642 [Pseudonocardiales bacterium]|jgi:uncharacterized protein YbjT (DUF2867 family)|nr:hypothetical protein [Pseudonocardiales bacterium]
MTNSEILVTGSTGLSGSIILRELAERAVPVRALVRDPEKVGELANYPNVEIFKGDMLKPESLRDALNGVERALMISSAQDRMVEAQQSFTDAALRAGVRHVIKYSGQDSGIGFNAQNFIAGRQHENLEDYLVNSGLAWTILRPSQFMQYYLPSTSTGVSLEEKALVLPIDQAKLSPVAIEDVAKVCAALLTEDGHEGRIYEMTGPDALTMTEACEIISRVTKVDFKYVNISLEEYEDALRIKGAPELAIQILTEISKERMKCVESHVKLTTHARFDVRPTNFAEFVYKNVGAFTDQLV